MACSVLNSKVPFFTPEEMRLFSSFLFIFKAHVIFEWIYRGHGEEERTYSALIVLNPETSVLGARNNRERK